MRNLYFYLLVVVLGVGCGRGEKRNMDCWDCWGCCEGRGSNLNDKCNKTDSNGNKLSFDNITNSDMDVDDENEEVVKNFNQNDPEDKKKIKKSDGDDLKEKIDDHEIQISSLFDKFGRYMLYNKKDVNFDAQLKIFIELLSKKITISLDVILATTNTLLSFVSDNAENKNYHLCIKSILEYIAGSRDDESYNKIDIFYIKTIIKEITSLISHKDYELMQNENGVAPEVLECWGKIYELVDEITKKYTLRNDENISNDDDLKRRYEIKSESVNCCYSVRKGLGGRSLYDGTYKIDLYNIRKISNEKPLTLIIETSYDHQRAFWKEKRIGAGFFDILIKHDVFSILINDRDHLKTQLECLRGQNIKFDNVIIRSHGMLDFIELAKNFSLYTKDLSEFKELFKSIAQNNTNWYLEKCDEGCEIGNPSQTTFTRVFTRTCTLNGNKVYSLNHSGSSIYLIDKNSKITPFMLYDTKGGVNIMINNGNNVTIYPHDSEIGLQDQSI